VSGANERANGRASGPVLQSVFLAVIDPSGMALPSLALTRLGGRLLSQTRPSKFQRWRNYAQKPHHSSSFTTFSRWCVHKRTQTLPDSLTTTVAPSWAPSRRSYSENPENPGQETEKTSDDNAAGSIDEEALLAEYYRSYKEEVWRTEKDADRDVRWMEMLGQRGVEGVFDLHELVQVLQAESVQSIVCIRVPDDMNYADYLVIGTGFSFRHLKSVMEYVKKLHKGKKRSKDAHAVIEGLDSEDWLVMDMGNIVLHLFQSHARTHWDLETLWTVGEEFDELVLKGRQKNEDLREMVYIDEADSWDLEEEAPSRKS